MKRDGKNTVLVIGGEPGVDLLPPEVQEQRRARTIRRRLGLGVIGVALIVIVGTGASIALALQAQSRLADEHARTPALLEEQTKYVEVRTVQNQVNLIKEAQLVGASTEIDWKKYLEGVQAILPASVTISTVTVDSATPLALYAQSTSPLQGARVATVSFTAESGVLPDVPTWMDALTTLPGFADALPASVVRAESGIYTVAITMHVNDAAYAQRFVTEGK